MIVRPDPVVSLDKTPGICLEGTRVLDAGSFSSYVWNTGSKARTITVNSIGIYAVTVTDNNGCKATDVTNITSCTICIFASRYGAMFIWIYAA